MAFRLASFRDSDEDLLSIWSECEAQIAGQWVAQRGVTMMPCFIITTCHVLFVVALINVCESGFPNGRVSSVEALIVPNSNQTEPTTSLDFLENGTFHCPYLDKLCLALCCPKGSLMIDLNCSPLESRSFLKFPVHYNATTLEKTPGQLRIDDFHVVYWNPCKQENMHRLKPQELWWVDYKLLTNGNIYLLDYDMTINFTNYCFGAVDGASMYTIEICFPEDGDFDFPTMQDVVFDILGGVALIISVPFFIVTFIVYSVIPDLRNMHGLTLRGYVGPFTFAYAALAVMEIVPDRVIGKTMCTFLAVVFQYSSLASFFWLNVMCFDIWWTFGRCGSLKVSTKQSERKKIIIYSTYAWGASSLITGICLIMDFVPNVPKGIIKPQFGVDGCWLGTRAALNFYFYAPMGVTLVSNMFFFISTAVKMMQLEKNTAQQLKGADSRRHDDNKQQFNIHLKLFIVMGLTWFMAIMSYIFDYKPRYFWFFTDLINNLQGVIIFVIFVWKDKIKRKILRRLGCHHRSLRSENSTRSSYLSSVPSRPTVTADVSLSTIGT